MKSMSNSGLQGSPLYFVWATLGDDKLSFGVRRDDRVVDLCYAAVLLGKLFCNAGFR